MSKKGGCVLVMVEIVIDYGSVFCYLQFALGFVYVYCFCCGLKFVCFLSLLICFVVSFGCSLSFVQL